jgi:uncharacterized protein
MAETPNFAGAGSPNGRVVGRRERAWAPPVAGPARQAGRMEWAKALCGGVLIGCAVVLLRARTGGIAGISGLVGRGLLPGQGTLAERAPALGFSLGLAAVGALFSALGRAVDVPHAPALLALGGLFVGLGTRLGSGCTSGHGICGVSRGSARSIVATLTFMATGILTVALEHGR